jgi:hypothetical protein
MGWILILFVHAGAMSNADSMALTNVSGFKTQSACIAAGETAKLITSGTVKATRYVCVKQD